MMNLVMIFLLELDLIFQRLEQEHLQPIKIVIVNAILTHGVMAIISVVIAEAKPNYLDQVKPLDFFAISLAAPFVLVAMFNDRIQ